MWTNSIALLSMHPLAALAPVTDPTALQITLSRAGATVVTTLILLFIAGLFSQRSWAGIVQVGLVALGVGSWVITNSYVLKFGVGVGNRATGAAQDTTGHGSNTSGTIYTAITVILLALAANWYRNERSRKALIVVILISSIFFSVGWAQEIALAYSNHIGVPVAKIFFGLFKA
jgi:glucan phosphoethanolaminetransferase (alkaline phosphatase superfamily)